MVPGSLVSPFRGRDGWAACVPLSARVDDVVAACYLDEGLVGLVVALVPSGTFGCAYVVAPGGRMGWAVVAHLQELVS